MAKTLDETALEYHRAPTPGKLAVVATKPLANQRDLGLAYSPGVAPGGIQVHDFAYHTTVFRGLPARHRPAGCALRTPRGTAES